MPIGRRPAVQGAGEGPRAPSCSGMTLTRTPIFVTLGGWRRSFPLARPLAFGRPWRATASRATRPRSSASASCRKGPSGSARTSRSVDRIYAKPLGVLGPFARQLDKKLTTTWIAYRGSLVEAVLKRSSHPGRGRERRSNRSPGGKDRQKRFEKTRGSRIECLPGTNRLILSRSGPTRHG
jgi:hypothetical protein